MTINMYSSRLVAFTAFGILGAGLTIAQDAPSNRPADPDSQVSAPRGWRRATDPPPPEPLPQATTPDEVASLPQQSLSSSETPEPVSGYPSDPGPAYNPPLDAYGPNAAYGPSYGPSQVPPELTVRPGSYLTVRIDQPLSSDRNHAGDGFSATLVRPLVIDGVIVAPRGQTVSGRVVEAQKAGRVEGVSRLAIELIDLGLVDGQQVPVKTQFINQSGSTAFGRDATGIGATTLGGAAIGGAVNGGVGAGVGAAAGLVVGTLGVLLTRGHPTVIYPESVLTFRVEAPITISTMHAPQAFRYVDPRDYERADSARPRYQDQNGPASQPYHAAPPYYGPAYYPPYYGYPSYYPFYGGLSFYSGPRFYGGRGYYRGGFAPRGYRRW